MKDLRLVEPDLKYKEEFISFVKEYQKSNEAEYINLYKDSLIDFNKYVRTLLDNAKGENLPEGWVPSSTFWLVDASKNVLGVIRIRHHLNDFLELHGGHVGFDISPSHRGHGYGLKILQLGIIEAKGLDIKEIILICDESNIRSKKVIEKCGGVFIDKIPGDSESEDELRYKIVC